MKAKKAVEANLSLIVIVICAGLLNYGALAEELGRFAEAPCPFPVPEGLTEGKDLTLRIRGRSRVSCSTQRAHSKATCG
jgi:hypothetical protein